MTGRALVLLLIAASTLYAANNVGVGWLYALGYALAAVVFASAAVGYWSLRGVSVAVAPAPRAEAGQALSVAVTLTTPRTQTRRMLCVMAPPLGMRRRLPWRRPLLPEGWGAVLIPELKARERLTVTLAIPAPQRGLHAMPAITLQAAPLGLVAWTRRVPPVDAAGKAIGTVAVHPRLHAIEGIPGLTALGGRSEARPASSSATAGELIRSVRPYRSGDAWRQIHWKTTARTGKLTVREQEGDAAARALAVWLDASSEVALEVAASLLAHAQGAGVKARISSPAGAPEAQTLDDQLDWLAGRTVSEPGGPAAAPSAPAIVITSCPENWHGRPDVCIPVPTGATIEDVLGRQS